MSGKKLTDSANQAKSEGKRRREAESARDVALRLREKEKERVQKEKDAKVVRESERQVQREGQMQQKDTATKSQRAAPEQLPQEDELALSERKEGKIDRERKTRDKRETLPKLRKKR